MLGRWEGSASGCLQEVHRRVYSSYRVMERWGGSLVSWIGGVEEVRVKGSVAVREG